MPRAANIEDATGIAILAMVQHEGRLERDASAGTGAPSKPTVARAGAPPAAPSTMPKRSRTTRMPRPSARGAAVRDVLTVLSRRWPLLAVDVLPVLFFAVIFGVALCVLVGVGIERVAYRPLRNGLVLCGGEPSPAERAALVESQLAERVDTDADALHRLLRALIGRGVFCRRRDGRSEAAMHDVLLEGHDRPHGAGEARDQVLLALHEAGADALGQRARSAA